MDVRWTTLGVALAAAALASCHRQPRPTYEYAPTETFVSTASEPAPERVDGAPAAAPEAAPIEAAPTDAARIDAAPAEPAPAEEPAAAVEPTEPAEPAQPADASEIEPGRWYKAKPW